MQTFESWYEERKSNLIDQCKPRNEDSFRRLLKASYLTGYDYGSLETYTELKKLNPKLKTSEKKGMKMSEFKFTEDQLKWIEALESDQYKQTRNKIAERVDNEIHFCCLGVANELFVPEQRDEDETCVFYWEENDHKNKILTVENVTEQLNLIKKSGQSNNEFSDDFIKHVHDIISEKNDNQSLRNHIDTNKNLCKSLTFLNDKLGFTFKEIAETLRKFPDMFFTNIPESASD